MDAPVRRGPYGNPATSALTPSACLHEWPDHDAWSVLLEVPRDDLGSLDSNMPMRGALSITSHSTAYFIGLDNTARMLLMRLSLSFFATRSARNRATTGVVISSRRSFHSLVPERSLEPLYERRCLLLRFRKFDPRRASVPNRALLGFQHPDSGGREILMWPGDAGRTEEAASFRRGS